jgi:hypothetical protein
VNDGFVGDDYFRRRSDNNAVDLTVVFPQSRIPKPREDFYADLAVFVELGDVAGYSGTPRSLEGAILRKK